MEKKSGVTPVPADSSRPSPGEYWVRKYLVPSENRSPLPSIRTPSGLEYKELLVITSEPKLGLYFRPDNFSLTPLGLRS